MDKYLLTVTVRADGSSKFAKGNQWGVFPSAALAWRLSDEAFMKGAQDWLSNLKVRLSYGTAGNNRISSGLMYTTYTMAGNTGKAPFFDESRGAMLEHGSNLYNPNLNGKQPLHVTLVLIMDSSTTGCLDHWIFTGTQQRIC